MESAVASTWEQGSLETVEEMVAALRRGQADKRQRTQQKRAGEGVREAQGKLESGQLTAQLLLWPETTRGVPNSLARTALFSAKINDDAPREYCNGRVIASLSNITLMYRGEELFQEDASVFMQLVHYARVTPLGAVVEFSGNSMLKALGWQSNSKGYARLKHCIERLTATAITVEMQSGDVKSGFGGSLVRVFRWKSVSGGTLPKWQIVLEPEIVNLFQHGTFTILEWEQRKMLNPRSALTLWLHSYLSTHRDPFPMSVDRYMELSNSGIKETWHFKSKLQDALKRLVQIGFLTEWDIDKRSGLVRVTRNKAHLPRAEVIPLSRAAA